MMPAGQRPIIAPVPPHRVFDMRWSPLAMIALLTVLSAPAVALELRVGSGAGCTHASLQAALDAIEGFGGDHNIRINAGTYPAADGMVYVPTVAQGFVRIEGGYASCTAGAPSGAPTADAGRSVFDGAGGLPRSVLELQINGLVGSVQLRRVALQGGDALNPLNRLNAGGGLAVYGEASVLVGSGVSIRNNQAGSGAGVALVGSRVSVNEPLARIDFFIDEGAEIRHNSAANAAGGIYCGGATTASGEPPMELRHGSVVHRDGSISSNDAGYASAILCIGSHAGGGYQPRPNPGAVALVSGNFDRAASVFGSGPVVATLDLVVAAVGEVRTLGAIGAGNNGIVLIQNNQSYDVGGLSLDDWRTRGGASPAPPTRPAFRLQNLLFIGNRVLPRAGERGVSALDSRMNADLTLAPSSPDQRCGFLPPAGACVLFEDNAPTGTLAADAVVPLLSTTYPLSLDQAHVRNNAARRSLIAASTSIGPITLRSSFVEGNTVAGVDSVLFEADTAGFGPADVFLSHTTVTGNAHDRYFRIEGPSRAAIQGTVLHNTGAPRLLRFGGAPNAHLTLRWCNYLTTLADAGFTGATQVTDSLGPLVTVTGALAFDAALNPPLALVDRCRPPTTPAASTPFVTPFDHYGVAFGFPFAPADPNRLADVGAVELRPDAVFANGFEAP